MKYGFLKRVKGMLSILLSVSMMMTSVSFPAFASEEVTEETVTSETETESVAQDCISPEAVNEASDISGIDLESELRDSVDSDEYPDGVISFGETMLNVSEGNETTIRVVRGGSTDKEARVTFKAIDVSAKYGRDYTLKVRDIKGDEILPENPEAHPLMDENAYIDNGEESEQEKAVATLNKAVKLSQEADEAAGAEEEAAGAEEEAAGAEEEAAGAEEEAAGAEEEAAGAEEEAAGAEEEAAGAEDVTGELSEETGEESSEEKPVINNKSTLSNAFKVQTGKEIREYDWREYDENTIDQKTAEVMAEGEDQAVEHLKEVEGVERALTFAPGEYLKEITVTTIKDGLGESEEQFAIVLYDAADAALGANYNGYVNIKDTDKAEEIVYEVKDKEVSVTAGEDKAVITVVRTTGTEQMGFVKVGTSAGSAKPGEDYESVVKELFFAPSVTEQTIEIPIIGSGTEYRDFYVGIKAADGNSRVNEAKDSTKVTIEPVIPAAVYSQIESAENGEIIPDGNGGYFVKEDLAGNSSDEESVEGAGKDVSGSLYNSSSHEYSADCWHRVANLGDISNADYVALKLHAYGGTDNFFYDWDHKDMYVKLYRDYNGNSEQASWSDHTSSYHWNNWVTINNNGFPKTSEATLWAKIYATGTNYNRNNHFKIEGALKHYKDYTFYINNNTKFAKYTEKKYTSTKNYTNATEVKMAEAKFQVNAKEQKDVQTFSIDGYVNPVVNYSGKLNSAGTASNADTVELKGYKLRNGDRYSDLLPTSFKMDKDFLYKYIGSYKQSGQGYDFELIPVFEPKSAKLTLKNEESAKGGFRGFNSGDTVSLTKLDSVDVNAYQNTGYSIKLMELTTDKGAKLDNSKSDNITRYLVGFGKNGTNYTLRLYYDVTALKIMADPLGLESYLKMGKVVYIDDNEKAYVGDYKNPLKLTGVQRYKTYNITGVTDVDGGYKPVWRDATLDNDEDGQWTKNDKIYKGFDVARGNILSYPMQLAVGRIYYNFEKRQKAAEAGAIEGVFELLDRPVLYQNDTNLTEVRGLNAAQVTCDGVTSNTKYGTLNNGVTKDGYFRLESENYSIYDQYLVNVVYDGPEGVINTGAPFYPNISKSLQVDATQELDISNVRIYKEVTVGKTATQSGKKEWQEIDTKTHDKNGNFTGLSCATPQSKAEGHADMDKKYLISMDVTKDGFKITGGELNFYDRNGQKMGKTVTAKAKSDGKGFNFEFKPNECDIEPGYTARVKFTDNQKHTYLERRLGVFFTQEIGMISISNEFLGGKAGFIDYVGNIASDIDLGWSGAFDTQGSVTTNEDGDRVISCGFAIGLIDKASSKDSDLMQKAKAYVEEQEKVGKAVKSRKAAEDALSKAGSGNTEKLQKELDKAREAEDKAIRKRDVAKDSFDEEAEKVGNGDKDKKNYKVGYKLSLSISFKLTIIFGIDDDVKSEKYGCYYFKSMTICAILTGEAGADVKFNLPFGFTVNIGIKLKGTGTFAFIIQEREDGEDNEEIRKKYRHYVATGDQTMAIWDISGEDRANDAMGAITLKPSITITLTVGALAGLIEGSISGEADFDMNFYINSSQSNDGTVTLSATAAVTALKVFKYEKTIASKKFQLFGTSMADEAAKKDKKQEEINGMGEETITGFEEAMNSLEAQNWLDNSAEGFKAMDTSYLAGGTHWKVGAAAAQRLENAESALAEEVIDGSLDDDESGSYVETEIADKLAQSPDFDMADLGNGKYVAVFTNVPANRVGDDKNATAAYFTVYDGGWKQPRLLDNDGSLDAYPRVFSLGKDRGAIMIWSTVDKEYKDTENLNLRQSALNLHGRFIGSDGTLLGDVIEITKTTRDKAAASANSAYADTLPDYSDFASDVAACVSFNDSEMIVYYSKREYDPDAGEVGDVIYPDYTAFAARLFTFGAGDKWYNGVWRSKDDEVTTNYMKARFGEYGFDDATAAERAKSYNECFYGQLFYDSLPDVTINEELDEMGYWKEGTTPTVTANSEDSPALVIDWDAISYDDLGLFGYSVDRDGNMKTYNDRDIYLQIFDFKDNKFVHPISVTTASESSEDSNVRFIKTKNATMLSWLSDGDIKMMDISRMVKNFSPDANKSLLLKSTVSGNDYYYINKARSKDESEAYIPPYTMVEGEKTEDTEADEAKGQKEEIGASNISSFDAVSSDDYIYFMWSQSGLKSTDYEETDDEGNKHTVADKVTEDQLYVARFNASTGECSLPVQVTSTLGAHYLDPAVMVNDEGGLTGLAYKAPTKKVSAQEFNQSIERSNEISDWDEQQKKVDEKNFDEFDIMDAENACAVAFKVLPEGAVKIKEAQISQASAGNEGAFSFEVLNDSVTSRENLKITAQDGDGNDLLTSVSINGTLPSDDSQIVISDDEDPFDTDEVLIEDLDTTSEIVDHLDTGYMPGGARTYYGGTFASDEEDMSAKIVISVYDGDTLLATQTLVKTFEEDCEVSDLKAENTGVRNEYRISGKVYNKGDALSAKHTLNIGFAGTDGDSLKTSVAIDRIRPYEEQEFETVITVDDSDFTAVTDEKGNLTESLIVYAAIKGDETERKETVAKRIAYADQMTGIRALTAVNLGTNNVVEVNVGESAAIAPEFVSTLASAEAESDGAMGVKYAFEEQSTDVFDITRDGVVNAFKEGTGQITLYVYPKDRTFEGENTGESLSGVLGQGVDGYAEMPSGAILTRKFTIAVAKPGETAAVTDEKTGSGYVVVSENSVMFTGLNEQAAATAKKMTIPASVKIGGKKYNVTAIAPDAFRGNQTLEKVVIGKNITEIGSGAFAQCVALKSVKFGKNVRIIGNEAFMGDAALKKIKLPKNLVRIGSGAFEGCVLITKLIIPKNVRQIANRAFALCSGIKSVTIKSPVLEMIGIDAFLGIDPNAVFKVGVKKELRESVAGKLTGSAGITETMTIKK